jgi:hypothetical protein
VSPGVGGVQLGKAGGDEIEANPERAGRAQTRASVTLPDDGHVWLKYGEKQLIYPRRTRYTRAFFDVRIVMLMMFTEPLYAA